MCPKGKLYKSYIDLELQVRRMLACYFLMQPQSREFDRCRTLYNKFLEFDPSNCNTWIKYAELELLLDDVDRARSIYEIAIASPLLDMPEVCLRLVHVVSSPAAAAVEVVHRL